MCTCHRGEASRRAPVGLHVQLPPNFLPLFSGSEHLFERLGRHVREHLESPLRCCSSRDYQFALRVSVRRISHVELSTDQSRTSGWAKPFLAVGEM